MASYLLIITQLSLFVSVRSQVKPPFDEKDHVLRAIPEEESLISDEYLMILNSDVITSDEHKDVFKERLAREFSANVRRHYTIGSLDLVHVQTDQKDMTDIIDLDEIAHISPNRMVGTREAVGLSICERHSNPYTWGLDRIDQRGHVHLESLQADTTYIYSGTDAGQGVNVYVLDSGVDVEHPEFEGRAVWGYTAVDMDGDLDLTGHGTHVAGTVGSNHYGVAKKTNIIAVKVLNCTGQGSLVSVFDGLHWIYLDHKEKSINSTRTSKSVINMSLGWKGDDAMYKVVITELVKQGINVVMAAGNEADDACLYNPVKDAITVGAVTKNDTLPLFSNWGECVDIFAPGTYILSTFPRALSAGGVQVLHGTSMATPHVSGVIARYLSTQDDTPSPHSVTSWLLESSSKGYITFTTDDLSKSPNRMVFITCDTSLE